MKKTYTQVDVVIGHCLKGDKPITQKEAWEMYRISRLAAVISKISDMRCYLVHRERVTVRTSYGSTSIARYKIRETKNNSEHR